MDLGPFLWTDGGPGCTQGTEIQRVSDIISVARGEFTYSLPLFPS